jgi:nucleoside-diphosphate-sugar epimerase
MTNPNKLRVILTGSTGMVGEGVLHECLQHPDVEQILVINRKPCGYSNPKLKEIIHGNFYDLSAIENQLAGYNCCLFCLGVSSVGMKEPEFFEKTYTLTMHVAETLAKKNPDMVFCYISGSGTDSTEKGRTMWARVKGKTENDLMKLPFKKAYAFRPGFLNPTPGLKNTLKYYAYIGWMYPLLKAVFPNFVSTLSELGRAMITVSRDGYERQVLEVKDIVKLGRK